MKFLSILLPSYNNKCYTLVECLQKQAAAMEDLEYEIIVADDGSRDQVSVISNLRINELPHCRYIRRQENVGRAAIRNFLASEAKGEWLLFLDSDVMVRHDDFVAQYCAGRADVVDGGVEVPTQKLPGNLRYIYEKQAEPMHTATQRMQTPYQHFHTANFMVSREVFSRCQFDENFHHYGYEDVLFGKRLQELDIAINHIDNPVSLEKFESNEQYMKKVEESLQTLHLFREQLEGYSALLHAYNHLRSMHLCWGIRLWHWLFGRVERHNLCGKNPCLALLNLYKLGYYASIS